MKTSIRSTRHPIGLIEGWGRAGMAGSKPGTIVIPGMHNDSGVAMTKGAVVVLLSDGTIELADVAQDTRPIGVALDAIADGDTGPVQWFGPVSQINTTGSVTAGNYAETTTTAGQATENATRREGSFGYFTETGTNPAGFLFGGAPDGSGASASSGSGGFDVTPPLSVAMPAWVKPSGSGVITADPQGRVTVVNSTTYKAFPGMTFLEGRLHLVYRDGSAHNSAGGVIKYAYSDTLGRTWSTPATIVSPSGSEDLRDPYITALANGRLLLSYHPTGTGGTVALRVEIRYSDDRGLSWSSAYTIPDTFSGQVAGSSPALELPDGTIIQPGYGDNGAGRYLSVVWFSTDGGLTFGDQTTVAIDGTLSFTEITVRHLASGNLVALIREETTGDTYRSVSTDHGATWSAEAMVIDNNVAGRPDFVEFYPGALLWFGRGTSTASRWAVSWDEGATWTAVQETDSGETLNAQYHAPVVLAPGYVAVVYGIENSGTDSDLYIRWYYDGYGVDPLGQARFDWLQVDEQATPSTPPSGKGIFYAGTDSKPYFVNDAGTASDLTSISGAAGGDLSGTYPNPSVVDDSHSHTSATAPGATTGGHDHIVDEVHSGNGSQTVFTLDNEAMPDTVIAYISGTRTVVTLGGTLSDEITFGSAPASAAGNISVDYATPLA